MNETETRPIHFLLVPIGSQGDVFPFFKIGQELVQRGHRVTMVTNGVFEQEAMSLGFGFESLGTADEYQQAIANPDLWHPRKGLSVLAELYLPLVPLVYDCIEKHAANGPVVVGAAGFAFGASIAEEKLGIPLATIHLQPSCFRSVEDPPVLHPAATRVSRIPRFAIPHLFRLADFAFDRAMRKPINEFRRTKGLPDVKRLVDKWWRSPRCAIGLFPEWFAERCSDWPQQAELTCFVRYDRSENKVLASEVAQFLEKGPPPIVFTPGSPISGDRDFFEQAIETCRILDCRGMILTPHRDQVPEHLPESIRHFDFLPFSQVFPQAQAVVHHGGIGTIAQGISSGIPQLIRPLAWDQPDNAVRVKRMGIGDYLMRQRFRAKKVAEKLRQLTVSRQVAERCRQFQNRMLSIEEDGLERCANILEALAEPANRPTR